MELNGVEWQILLVPYNHPELMRNDGTNAFTLGSCNNLNKTIYICDSLQSSKMWKVLCHEITHAAMFSYHITLTYEQEELLADLLATYGEEIISTTNKIMGRLIN